MKRAPDSTAAAFTPVAGAARRGISVAQAIAAALLTGVTAWGLTASTLLTLGLLTAALQLAFFAMAAWRVVLIVASARRVPTAPAPRELPRYTILAALHDEAAVAGQLIRRLDAIDYPRARLEAFLVLEADDDATRAAVRRARPPSWLRVVVVPAGRPRTKPRALNHALERARGDLLAVYDAEDAPDPHQLREAAARFAHDAVHGDGRLACLQAPLRIRTRRERALGARFIGRQFAAEYASQFETVTPGLAALGLPFPLGGTSNHFRTDVLRAVGGWDAYNVTEDADLGFRLWRHGWRADVLTRPTWESPPSDLGVWLPQRTRWLKGFMQTFGVNTRDMAGLGWRGALSITATIGAAVAAAAAHAPAMAWLAVGAGLAALSGIRPELSRLSLSVLVLGAATTWLACAIGARRARAAYGPLDMLVAPAYWSLLSLAFVHALWRLLRDPHAWDKTPHVPDDDETDLETPTAARRRPGGSSDA